MKNVRVVKRKLRMYEPIWEALKAVQQASISAPDEYHPRIIAMVKKEKDCDTAYKLELAEKLKKAKLEITRSRGHIEFMLHITFTIYAI